MQSISPQVQPSLSQDDLGTVRATGAVRAPRLSVEHQVKIELGRLIMGAITKEFGDKVFQPDIVPSLTAYFEHHAQSAR